jgi:hypothetical protein
MSRKISFSGIILAGTLLFCTDLSAQRLCRNDSTGFVRWVSGNCPSGFTNINNSVRSEYLRANSVTTAKIQDGAVTDEKIAGVSAAKVDFTGWTAPNNSVATASIQNGAVTNDKIAAGVSASKINFTGWTVPAGAVVSSSIATGAVTSAAIADGTITTDDVNQIDASKIVNLPPNSGVLADDSVDTIHIKNNAVTDSKIAAGTIQDVDISSSANISFSKINPSTIAITSSMLQAGSVNTAKIQDGAVNNSHLATGAVTSAKIVDNSITDADISPTAQIAFSKVNSAGQITAADLAPNSVTASKLASNSVDTSKILDGSVTTDKLADGAVTSTKLASESVDSAKILDGTIKDEDINSSASIAYTKLDFTGWQAPANSVSSGSFAAALAISAAKIKDNSVTSDKIQDGAITHTKIQSAAVTEGKLAPNAVTSAKFVAGAVTEAKLDDGSVTSAKFDSGAVTSAKIADNSINTQHIQDGAVTNANLASNSVTSDKIAAGAVTNAKFQIDPAGPIPYHTFLASTNTMNANTAARYIGLTQLNQTPASAPTAVATRNAFGCTQGLLVVNLSTAPGSGQSWTFEVRKDTSTIPGANLTIAGSNTSGSVAFSGISSADNLSIALYSTSGAAPTKATTYFLCK